VQESIDSTGGALLHQGDDKDTEFAPDQRTEPVETDAQRRRSFLALILAHLRGQLPDDGRGDSAPHRRRNSRDLGPTRASFALHDRHQDRYPRIRRLDHELKRISPLVDAPEVKALTRVHCVT
jgi:hypothetical protein